MNFDLFLSNFKNYQYTWYSKHITSRILGHLKSLQFALHVLAK